MQNKENKRVKNATAIIIDGITFKSKLEGRVYEMLKDEGFNPQYEPETFHVWKGKKFSVPCYDSYKNRKLKKEVWGLNKYKPVDLKYTPDFIFHTFDSFGIERMIIIEAKGFPTEKYHYQKKLFRSLLEEEYPNSMFFEVHNQKQMKAAIEVIKGIKV